MCNVVKINRMPMVFNPMFVARLAEANRALRQLRDFGCKVLKVEVASYPDESTRIVVDRNSHKALVYCPGVHVTHGAGR